MAPGSPLGHRRAVPVLGMLKVMLRRDLVAGGPGQLGKLQVAGVLHQGAATAARTAATVLGWFVASRNPVPGS